MPFPFYKVQAGQEGTAGTPVAATAKWMAMQLYPKVADRDIRQAEEDRGSLAAHFRGYTVQQKADLGNLVGDVTFEDILFPLHMAIKTAAATQPDSAESPATYLHTFSPSLTSANTPKTFTVEWGDNNQVWESEYVIATGLTISGAIGDVWKFSAPLVGRQHTTTSFTGALSDRTVESCVMNKSKLYMDDTGGSIGSTQIEGAFLGFEWRLPAHFVPLFTGDGALYFYAHSEVKMKPELDLRLIVDSTTKTLITTKYTTPTIQLVRVEGLGSLIEDAFYKYIYIDGAYRIMDVSEISDSDGQSVVTMKLSGEYDSTWAKLFEVIVENSVSVIP